MAAEPELAASPIEPVFAAALLAPEIAAAEMAPAVAPTEEPAERAAEAAPVVAPGGEAPPEAPSDQSAMALEAALEPTSDLSPEAVPEEAPEEAPEEPAPARKMPTLAVMAALAQRAEPVRPPDAQRADMADMAEGVDTAPQLRAVRPTAPLTERLTARLTAQLDAAELDAVEQLDQRAPEPAVSGETPAAATTAPLEPSASVAPAPPADDLADVLDAGPADSPERVAPVEPTELQPSAGEDSTHRMWWPAALRRRAAPQTLPIAEVLTDRAPLDIDAEPTAPRAAPRIAARRAAPADTQGSGRASGQAPEAETRAEPRRSGREPAQRPAQQLVQQSAQQSAQKSALAGEQFSRRAQVTGARLRARAMRSPRLVVLSWTAGGHVAVAFVAALIAVIAALRSSAGPDALAVFNWALALALIAGLGAAAGYACAQTRRPRLATLALILSQLGGLAWALALLGPRAALLLLAPTSAALALRGAGRLSAIAAATGWLALFVAAVALNLTGQLTPALALDGAAAALVDVALALVGLWLAVSILNSLYLSRLNVVARARAVEHAALLTEAQLDRLRTQTDDDADALRRTLRQALRGEQPERVYARGSLSVVAEEVNTMVDRLVDLGLDRVERKRLESAARRLTRVIERAWLGLSWSWPDATGTMLDDLLALLRMPPPVDTPDLLDDTTPTGQVVAPHLFRSWQAPEADPADLPADLPADFSAQRTQPGRAGAPSAPGYPSLPSMPSYPSYPSYSSLPSLWPSDPGLDAGLGLIDPLELPPSPRWRRIDGADRAERAERAAAADALADPADQQGAPDR